MRILLVLALVAGPAIAAEECQNFTDRVLRLACYKKSAIPERCQPLAKDPALQSACIDLAVGSQYKPAGVDEARLCQVFLPDKDAALACYQTATRAPETLTEPVKPVDTWTIQVREQSLPKLSKLKDPAQIGYKHESHRSDPIVKAGIVMDGPTLGFIPNWNWVAGLDINLDLSSPPKQRANSKTFSAGARGTLFGFDRGFTIDSNLRATAKYDAELHTRSVGMVAGQLFLKDHWIKGGFGQGGLLPFQFVPAFGYAYEDRRRVESGKSKGAFSSVYAGASLALWPSGLERTQFNLRYQRFVDLSASDGLTRRYLKYASFGIDYFLYDPTKDVPAFAPRIALVREIGDDPLSSTVDKNRTLLVFKFTLN